MPKRRKIILPDVELLKVTKLKQKCEEKSPKEKMFPG